MNVMTAELLADNTPVFHMIIQKVFNSESDWCGAINIIIFNV